MHTRLSRCWQSDYSPRRRPLRCNKTANLGLLYGYALERYSLRSAHLAQVAGISRWSPFSRWLWASAQTRRCSAWLLRSLLRPLPFPEPDRLVAVAALHASGIGRGAQSRFPTSSTIASATVPLQYLAAYHTSDETLTGVGEPMHVEANVVTTGFFEALGVQPQLGQNLSAGRREAR